MFVILLGNFDLNECTPTRRRLTYLREFYTVVVTGKPATVSCHLRGVAASNCNQDVFYCPLACQVSPARSPRFRRSFLDTNHCNFETPTNQSVVQYVQNNGMICLAPGLAALLPTPTVTLTVFNHFGPRTDSLTYQSNSDAVALVIGQPEQRCNALMIRLSTLTSSLLDLQYHR
jgi:hypothetical protein